ncbi:MAG: hypothetical protein ACRDJ9_34210, partial [Dehalococcoidia bacterium]
MLVIALLFSSVGSIAPAALAQGAPEPGSLRAMLQQTPLVRLGGDTLGAVTYANLALQAELTGVAPPPDDRESPATDAWLAAIGRMTVHSRAMFFLQPEWNEFFGFDLFDLDQVVEYSAPPTSLSLFRGRFDADDLVQRWQAVGYQTRVTEAGTFYAIRGDFEIDVASEGSQMAMASANYLALIAPDTIAFASTEQLITEAVNLAEGNGTSFAGEINVASLLEGVPDTLVSGLIVSGTQLLALGDPAEFLTEDPAELDPEAIATRMAEEAAAAAELPPLGLVLLGSTGGGPLGADDSGAATPVAGMPEARAVAVVVTANDAAAWTVAEVVDRRLAGSSGGIT